MSKIVCLIHLLNFNNIIMTQIQKQNYQLFEPYIIYFIFVHLVFIKKKKKNRKPSIQNYTNKVIIVRMLV